MTDQQEAEAKYPYSQNDFLWGPVHMEKERDKIDKLREAYIQGRQDERKSRQLPLPISNDVRMVSKVTQKNIEVLRKSLEDAGESVFKVDYPPAYSIELTVPDDWIAVTERLPEKYGKYLVYRAGKIHFEIWNNLGWAYNFNTITHWMPLPDQPQ